MLFDINLWGNVKDRIHVTKVRDFETSWARIVEPVGTITPDMLQGVWAVPDCRPDILRISNGANVEVNDFIN